MPEVTPRYTKILEGYDITGLSKHELELLINGLKRLYEDNRKDLLEIRKADCDTFRSLKPEIDLVSSSLVRIGTLIRNLEGGQVKNG